MSLVVAGSHYLFVPFVKDTHAPPDVQDSSIHRSPTSCLGRKPRKARVQVWVADLNIGKLQW